MKKIIKILRFALNLCMEKSHIHKKGDFVFFLQSETKIAMGRVTLNSLHNLGWHTSVVLVDGTYFTAHENKFYSDLSDFSPMATFFFYIKKNLFTKEQKINFEKFKTELYDIETFPEFSWTKPIDFTISEL